MPMRPDSKASSVLAVLREGPATTGEVAAELGWSSHSAGSHLKNLHQRAKVDREPFEKAEGFRRDCFLWSIREEVDG